MNNRSGWNFFFILALVFFNLLIGFNSPARSGDPYSAYYSSKNDRIFWFIHISDIHIGTKGTQDSSNLQWIVTDAKNIIEPSFIVASGDLTDSTNGNLFGYPDGPHYEEWNEYRGILNAAGIDSSFYYDIPGNHDAYSDRYFSYYLSYSVQGQATGQTQISWTREFSFGKYHFLGINTADNTGNPFSLVFPWGDNAGLDINELAFIQTELEGNQDADLTLIFGHHPVTDTGYSTDTWLFYGHTQFISYLDLYNASLYGYGHTHRFEEDIFSGNYYTGFMQGKGIYYFNIASLGKSSANQYSIIAVDCNGISILTKNVNMWPGILITAPLDKYFGGDINPYVYNVPKSRRNPVRALIFDPKAITGVHYRIDGSGDWYAMSPAPVNPHLWEALWDASALPEGEHSVEVRAVSASGTSTDLIRVNVITRIVLPWIELLLF
ncbi:MAG: metallophosphoesterase [Bacteroidales bacterium]|nr:metallophosphoesterase [Bacteroidales bacterium]